MHINVLEETIMSVQQGVVVGGSVVVLQCIRGRYLFVLLVTGVFVKTMTIMMVMIHCLSADALSVLRVVRILLGTLLTAMLAPPRPAKLTVLPVYLGILDVLGLIPCRFLVFGMMRLVA
jgi:hypothetical protein